MQIDFDYIDVGKIEDASKKIREKYNVKPHSIPLCLVVTHGCSVKFEKTIPSPLWMESMI